MPAVACPGCGAVVDLPAVSRSSTEFCRSCDYPLFWAGTSARATDEAAMGMTIRRRPGAGGHQLVATETCPACQELNRPTNVYCQRCGAEMHPAAPPVTATLPPPAPVAAPPAAAPAPPPLAAAPPERRWWRGWLLVAVLFALLAAFVIATIILLALGS